MGRWTPDEHGCIYDEAGCFARLTPNKAERLATRHNADIDALTAERDAVEAELAAANDTLDRLREVLAKWMAFDAFNAYDAIGEIRAILYPPETTDDDR